MTRKNIEKLTELSIGGEDMDFAMSTLKVLTDDPDTIDIGSVDTSLSFIDKISGHVVPRPAAKSGLSTLSNLLGSLKANQMDSGRRLDGRES
jgi:hypothetical protein